MKIFSRKLRPTRDSEVPERFRVSGSTLLTDRIMTCAIVAGGLTVIASVIGIFVFILAEALPLFSGASVDAAQTVSSNPHRRLTQPPDMGRDWLYVSQRDGELLFYHTGEEELAAYAPPLREGESIAAAAAEQGGQGFVILTSSGRLALLDEGRTEPVWLPIRHDSGRDAIRLSAARRGDDRVILIYREGGRGATLVTVAENMMSDEPDVTREDIELSSPADASVMTAALNDQGERLALLTSDNTVRCYFYDEDEELWMLAQTLSAHIGHEDVTTVDWLFGGESLVAGGADGSVVVYSIYPHLDNQGRKVRLLGLTKSMPGMPGAVRLFASSGVNRSFLAASDSGLALYYGTTGSERWSQEFPGLDPARLSPDNHLNGFTVLDSRGGLHYYRVRDEHPEAGAAAFFGKIQYEGYPAPEWQWQSVGGSDSYEAKLSLVPLIFGTFKGTLYALLFAVPVALAAAVYTAHFMTAPVKKIVKPTMEIMASLPSVVLGFFGALYIAPLMEHKVPALICMVVVIPMLAVVLGLVWKRCPMSIRRWTAKGWECFLLIPVAVVAGWFCWEYLGDWVEPALVKGIFFLVGGGDAAGSNPVFADLWRNGFGLAYEQRNSLVVGFMMGFAVIPVIFTIAEDALSNVPPSLIHASEALGADKWQVVRTVVLPVAAAGIFSALMIGFGRAIGETMIVLMATGNTPVMDWNIFNGMRTLSANIATELPEAAVHSTHYRVLFLCALILFIMTFSLNTIAEILRDRLRKRYQII